MAVGRMEFFHGSSTQRLAHVAYPPSVTAFNHGALNLSAQFALRGAVIRTPGVTAEGEKILAMPAETTLATMHKAV